MLKRLNSSFEAASGTWEQADQAIEKMGRETAEALRDGLRETLTSVARLTGGTIEESATGHDVSRRVSSDVPGDDAVAC